VKNLKSVVVGFVVFNCLTLAAFAACSGHVTYNGQYCGFTGGLGNDCRYECPDGTIIEITSCGGDTGIECENG